MMTSSSTAPEALLSAPQFQEKATGSSSCATHTSPPVVDECGRRRQPDVDLATGQMRPISAEEWQARQADLTQRLAEIDAEDDSPDEVYDEFIPHQLF
jgi:hypothetical protein